MNNTKSKLDLKKLQKKFDEILESMSDEDLLKYIERGKKKFGDDILYIVQDKK